MLLFIGQALHRLALSIGWHAASSQTGRRWGTIVSDADRRNYALGTSEQMASTTDKETNAKHATEDWILLSPLADHGYENNGAMITAKIVGSG